MADTIVYLTQHQQPPLAFKAVDNGDGSYSLGTKISGGGELSNGGFKRFTPTIDAGTDYVNLDCIGGIQTIANFVTRTGGAARINKCIIKDFGAIGPALTLMLFRATPAGGTYADNGALVLDATDLDDMVASYEVQAVDWKTVGTKKVVHLSGLDDTIECAATSLYALIQANAGYNAGSAADLMFGIGYEKQ